jgi:molybdopterin molybdotransferase
MNTPFDTIVVVDWSGGKDRGSTPKKDAIWACVARAMSPERPVYLRSRAVALAWLADFIALERANGRRALIAFDFPFGYPAGFAERVVGRPDPLALCDWFAAELPLLAPDNQRFDVAVHLNERLGGAGPFWFRPASGPAALPLKKPLWRDRGFAERRIVEQHLPRAFVSWQMGGAGAVGSQTMTGMAALSRLRRWFPDDVSVWPFEPRGSVELVELWPSLIADTIRDAGQPGEIKDATQVRVWAQLLYRLAQVNRLDTMLAGVPSGPATAEEGWILGTGHETLLRQSALGQVSTRGEFTPARH